MKNLVIITLPYEEENPSVTLSLKREIKKMVEQFGFELIENNSPLQAEIKLTIEEGLKTVAAENKPTQPSSYYTAKDLCKKFGVTPVTIRAWRKQNLLPAPIILGRRLYWPSHQIDNLNLNGKGKN